MEGLIRGAYYLDSIFDPTAVDRNAAPDSGYRERERLEAEAVIFILDGFDEVAKYFSKQL